MEILMQALIIMNVSLCSRYGLVDFFIIMVALAAAAASPLPASETSGPPSALFSNEEKKKKVCRLQPVRIRRTKKITVTNCDKVARCPTWSARRWPLPLL